MTPILGELPVHKVGEDHRTGISDGGKMRKTVLLTKDRHGTNWFGNACPVVGTSRAFFNSIFVFTS